MEEEKITAAEMLKEGLDDGRYASIEDDINIDINTSHYQGIIEFAKDFAAQEVEPIEKQRDGLMAELELAKKALQEKDKLLLDAKK